MESWLKSLVIVYVYWRDDATHLYVDPSLLFNPHTRSYPIRANLIESPVKCGLKGAALLHLTFASMKRSLDEQRKGRGGGLRARRGRATMRRKRHRRGGASPSFAKTVNFLSLPQDGEYLNHSIVSLPVSIYWWIISICEFTQKRRSY